MTSTTSCDAGLKPTSWAVEGETCHANLRQTIDGVWVDYSVYGVQLDRDWAVMAPRVGPFVDVVRVPERQRFSSVDEAGAAAVRTVAAIDAYTQEAAALNKRMTDAIAELRGSDAVD